MKEIHEERFNFVPQLCTEPLQRVLLTPVPAHLLQVTGEDETAPISAGLAVAPAQTGDGGGPSLLPLPISLLTGGGAGTSLSRRGQSILCAITAPLASSATKPLTARERILRALTDDAYA